MRKGRIKSPCVSLECIKSSVTVFQRTNLQAGKQRILVTCYRNLYRNRFSPIQCASRISATQIKDIKKLQRHFQLYLLPSFRASLRL